MSLKLGVIGCGKMADALLTGFINSINTIENLLVNDIDQNIADSFAKKFSGSVSEQSRLIAETNIVLLAVKPHQIENVLDLNKDYFREDQIVISIAAGITTTTIENILGKKCAVIRVMPNTPTLVGKGVTAIAKGRWTTNEDIELANRLFNSVGKVYKVDEKCMDAITAISGSGPAYVYTIVEALINAGILIGLDSNLSKELVLNTINGTITMIEQSQKHPAQLREEVCSPGGTTIVGVRALEDNGLRSAIYAGVEKAYQRAQELGKK